MRVGILTFHDAINYGAVLQAQGLCEVINSFDAVNCEIIDYKSVALEQMYYINNIKSVKEFIRRLYVIVKKKTFEHYLKSKCVISKSVNKKSISKIFDKYDAIIVGSDQVWNGNITGNDDIYLLPFCSEKIIKGSYAASIGNYNITDSKKENYIRLKEFKGISVREPEAACVISKLTGRDVKVHIDPTLLVNNKYWDKIAISPSVRNKYIFIYASGDVKKIIQVAKVLKKMTQYDIYYMGNYEIENAKKISFVTPDRWLGFIKNAEIVLTNSFHGTAFSIIFEKNFFVDLGWNEEKQKNKNNRAENLLEMFGLTKQVIENAEQLYKCLPDMTKMRQEKLRQQDKAISYLKDILCLSEEE